MFYLDFLRALHDRLSPRTYLEIGVAQGHSLGLARCRSIGIDPAFQVDQELVAPVSLLRSTSDEYFARLEAEGTPPFGGLPIDFAYIDGMHLLEYALRDFIGVEQYSARSSVVAFDDVLPRNVEEAARDRHVMPWTGDVFRIPLVLTEHPDRGGRGGHADREEDPDHRDRYDNRNAHATSSQFSALRTQSLRPLTRSTTTWSS